MALSNDLISQFAKLTKEEKPTNTETTVYGTIVESNGVKSVQLDGSDQTTPITSTVATKAGDRVTVINDDKPIIRKIDGEFYVYGTPWQGKESIGKNIPALILSVLQNGLAFIPLITLLPIKLGLLGIQLSQPLAYVISAVICLPCLIVFLKRLPDDK